MQLHQEKGPLAIHLLTKESDRSRKPAVSENGANRIGSFNKGVRYLISLILNPYIIVGPARGKPVANSVSVDPQIV
ncbi:hypothetical protein D3C71_1992330 [compost metagenome]